MPLTAYKVGQLRERSVECVENPVELDPHRERQRVPGRIIGRGRRTARIRNVVRMILRLEHVHHVRPERLGRFHDERVRRIRLAVHGERRRRAQDRDAGLDERVDELRRGAEVRLIGRDDERAGHDPRVDERGPQRIGCPRRRARRAPAYQRLSAWRRTESPPSDAAAASTCLAASPMDTCPSHTGYESSPTSTRGRGWRVAGKGSQSTDGSATLRRRCMRLPSSRDIQATENAPPGEQTTNGSDCM